MLQVEQLNVSRGTLFWPGHACISPSSLVLRSLCSTPFRSWFCIYFDSKVQPTPIGGYLGLSRKSKVQPPLLDSRWPSRAQRASNFWQFHHNSERFSRDCGLHGGYLGLPRKSKVQPPPLGGYLGLSRKSKVQPPPLRGSIGNLKQSKVQGGGSRNLGGGVSK